MKIYLLYELYNSDHSSYGVTYVLLVMSLMYSECLFMHTQGHSIDMHACSWLFNFANSIINFNAHKC